MRWIYWTMPVIIFGMAFFAGFNFYGWCVLAAMVGAALVFPKKSQKTLEHLPRIIAGAIGYGLMAGIFFIAIPMYYWIQDPMPSFDYYFKYHMMSAGINLLEIGGVLVFMIFISGLAMLVIKGTYFLIKEKRR